MCIPKAEWIGREGYGGSMVWSLSLDDFTKSCSSSVVSSPLTRTLSTTLQNIERAMVLNFTSTTRKIITTPTTSRRPTPTTVTTTTVTSRPIPTTVSPIPQVTKKLWTADIGYDVDPNKIISPPIWQPPDLVFGPSKQF